MPAADVESAYFEPLVEWRSAANSSAGSSFFGIFGDDLALAGNM